MGNYDPRTDEAIKYIRDRWEGLLVKSINEQQRTWSRNLFTETRELSLAGRKRGYSTIRSKLAS